MTIERVLSGKALSLEEEQAGYALRPRTLDEYIGQEKLKEKLRVSLDAVKARGEPFEHTLFYGPPGLGKTTLAHIISAEMKTRLTVSSGPALVRPADLLGILTNLESGDILFIDEIHRLSSVVEEVLYPAMEDFKVDFVVDKGAYAKTIQVPLKRFTLIGATTRAGLVTRALRDRFGLYFHLDFYPPEELEEIIIRSSRILGVEIEKDAVKELSVRSRGTPRIANRLLRRVRDYAEVRANGKVSVAVAKEALKIEGIDEAGLDELDRRFLEIIIEHYSGGPVGIEAISATLNEEVDTLVDLVEPYLLKSGFLNRTRQGRIATRKAYEHLGIKKPKEPGSLFE